MCLVNLSCRGICTFKWNPQILIGLRLSLLNPQTFAESANICGIRNNYIYSIISEYAAIFSRSRNKTNVVTKFTLQVFCGIHGKFVSGIHIHFGTSLKTCLWNPGIYRHKNVRLSSASFGLVMVCCDCPQMCVTYFLFG